MNILLIAPYRTYSGWGEGSKHLAKSLNTLDHNLAIRPIYMSNEIDTTFNDSELLELEQASYDNYDVVIQRVLPNFFRKIPNSINILTCVFETSNIRSTPWWRHLNLADGILVPSNIEKQGLIENDIKVPVYSVSEAIDITKYDRPYTPIPELEGTFNFYFVGEFIERKNITALITAFHREFRTNEPVNLVIKTAGNIQQINNTITNIKQNLRIYHDLQRYKKEQIITARLDEQGMHNLHNSCHCFVMPSFGEAYCRPVVDALGYGNTPIVNDNTGMVDYIHNNNGWVVNSRIEPVQTSQPPIPYIYTAKENWVSIDILDLMKCMREAYKQRDIHAKLKKDNAYKKAIQTMMKQFSYQTIGQKIQKALDAITSA